MSVFRTMTRSISLFFLILLVIEASVSMSYSENLIVETKVGKIRGLKAHDGKYRMYLGIPYATVNKSNVFGKSIPITKFEGVYEANDNSAISPQIEELNFTSVGKLDSLRLNIFVPESANPQTNLPVMVYIFGGRFRIGSTNRHVYGPQYLVRHNVILVTINYRLGPFGFMCLDTPEVPGNAGLKDQVLALRWIQDNIKSFGGDPQKVTLFGHSSGSMCVALHMISETEKLFSNVIIQSGPEFHPDIFVEAKSDAPLKLAALLNYKAQNIDDAIRFLSSVDVHNIIDASTGIVFRPCIEKDFPGVESFLKQYPINSNHSKLKDMAVMLGFTSDEMVFNYLSTSKEISTNWMSWEKEFEENLRNYFDFDENNVQQLSFIIRKFYLGDNNINSEQKPQVVHYSSDFFYIFQTIRSIKPYLEAGALKVYQYVFTHQGSRNLLKYMYNFTYPGSCHADELGYLFKMYFLPDLQTEKEILIVDRMTTMWTNFAKYRDPIPKINALLPVKWEPITKGSPYYYMNINITMSAGMGYESRRMAFWELFYESFGKNERRFKKIADTEPLQRNVKFTPLNLILMSIILSLVVIVSNI